MILDSNDQREIILAALEKTHFQGVLCGFVAELQQTVANAPLAVQPEELAKSATSPRAGSAPIDTLSDSFSLL